MEEQHSVKKQLVSGVFYTAVAKYAGMAIFILINGVLSRLLTPDDFGTIVPITVIVSFFTILGDVGIGPAVIQNNDLTRKNIESIFSFTILVGLGLSLIFFFSSWAIAGIYDSPIFVVLCQVLTLSLFFSCANVVPNALLYKAKMFRYLAVRSLVVQLIAGAVAIASALMGAGLYALIVQSVLSSVALFIITYRKNPLKLNFFRIDPEPLRKIRNFSSYQFLFNIFNYFAVNLDKLLLKKYMGSVELGYYDKSYKLMQMPLQNIPFILTPVMHPIFSDMQNDRIRMQNAYSKVVRLLSFIGFPLSVLLYFTGRELIFILFGLQWAGSIPPFQILALSVGFQILLATSGSIFQSCNATHLLLLSGVLSTITIVVGILVGLFVYQTLEAIAFFLLCAFAANFLMCFIIMYCVLFKAGIMPFLKQLFSPLILTGVIAGVLYGVSLVIPDINIIVSLIIKGALAGGLAIAYIHFTKEYDLPGTAKQYLARLRSR